MTTKRANELRAYLVARGCTSQQAGQVISGVVGRRPAEVRELIAGRLAARYMRRVG